MRVINNCTNNTNVRLAAAIFGLNVELLKLVTILVVQHLNDFKANIITIEHTQSIVLILHNLLWPSKFMREREEIHET